MSSYFPLSTVEFFDRVRTERQARRWLWRSRFPGRATFECPRCTHRGYWEHRSRPEIRTCASCGRQVRLRAGTILEHTKLPILTWLRAIFLVTQDKRGVSALQLMRQLRMKSKDTSWRLLHRIRRAMAVRDERYHLKGIIELDGAEFGEQKDKGQRQVLLGVETRTWTDDNGTARRCAGFAKVKVSRETSIRAQEFVDGCVRPGTEVHTDGDNAYAALTAVKVESKVMGGDQQQLDAWLPWVFHWVENAKAWLRATYHGVSTKYFALYLAEYNYRFNRRHDQNGMFHRALTACATASPIRAHALFGE